MFTEQEKIKIKQYYDLALDRIKNKNIGCFKGHDKPLFLISEYYPGVWLEHVYDSVFLAKMDNAYLEITKNTLELFLNNQKDNGQLPCFVLDKNKDPIRDELGYSQTQECVSFTRLCYEYFETSGDIEFLKKAYPKCIAWQKWHETYRMPSGKGLVEAFCGHDTGHDASGRKDGMTYPGTSKDMDATVYPEGDAVLPIIAPDVNAVYYGTLTALADMAKTLGKQSDSEKWTAKAKAVKKALKDVCYDENDAFYYDVDKNGNKRKYLSISITNVLTERALEPELAELIYNKHLRNPDEFYTEYPFPAMAKSDPSFKQNKKGNSWGFYSQALTILRCTRWMDYYGKGKDFDEILEKWIAQWTFENEIMFGQELHPLTGKPSNCSQWYSSCMLVYIYAVKRLKLC